MLSGTFTVRCWNYYVGKNRGFIELLEDAGIPVVDRTTKFNIVVDGLEIECYYGQSSLLNKKTDRKICDISYEQVSYNFKPEGHSDHEMTIFVSIVDWISTEDFLEKVRRSNSFKNPNDLVCWDDCVGNDVKSPIDNDNWLKYTVTAVGQKNFLATDEHGEEKTFLKLDGFWFYA